MPVESPTNTDWVASTSIGLCFTLEKGKIIGKDGMPVSVCILKDVCINLIRFINREKLSTVTIDKMLSMKSSNYSKSKNRG